MEAQDALLERAEARRRPPSSVGVGARLRTVWQITQALLVFAFLAWLATRGAQAMEYRWQWYRVEPFFYRVIDGEIIWGPLIRGVIVTLQLASVSSILSILIGFVTAFARMSNSIALTPAVR